MFKFLHAADIHLDSPVTKLSAYPGAPVEKIRLATREALANLVRLAIDERVAFVVIAGDVYDGDWDDYNTGHYFNQQMQRLANEGISVYLISGNHDAENHMTRNLPTPPNVTVFPTTAPATFRAEHVPVSLHGQGFASRSITQDLSQHYPAAEAGRFNIGILHTCAEGSDAHANYAPCSVKGLVAKGYDYWALGHIHQREILRERQPMIAFSGNIQGRHIREQGAKGCLLVEVDDNNQIARHSFVALDSFRWEVCQVDLADAENSQEVQETILAAFHRLAGQTDGRPAAIRVLLLGSSKMHDELFAAQTGWIEKIRALAAQQGSLWVEKVKFQTTPIKSARNLADLDGPISELSACFRAWAKSEEKLTALRESFSDVKTRVPAEILEGEDGIQLDNLDWLKQTLDEVQKMVVGRLLSQEEAP